MDMIETKPLEASDYPVLKPVFQIQPYNLSIYSLFSLIVWNTGPIRSCYAFDGDSLMISSESTSHPQERYLILPISGREPLTPEELHHLALERGYRQYRFVPGDVLDIMKGKQVEQWFWISEQTGFEDYVYRTDDLSQLKGNRYAGKRNLIHQFVREYDRRGRVAVANLGPGDRDACLSFLEKWCLQRQCDQHESLACEERALVHALTHMEVLESKGLVVRVDGVVSAIAVMSALNEGMGVLNFEKAFPDIRGLYQFLDNECAKRLFPQYEFINKESDMNIAELARSKRSYHPVQRIKSYCLTIR